MRSAYRLPPILAASNTPVVKTATGLGTGGGAYITTADSSGYGDIVVIPGPGYTAAGSVAITFPNTPPSLFISADEQFGAVTQATVGNVVTISWTNAKFPAPGSPQGYNIHYEWL
jgi:hypothetical protein